METYSDTILVIKRAKWKEGRNNLFVIKLCLRKKAHIETWLLLKTSGHLQGPGRVVTLVIIVYVDVKPVMTFFPWSKWNLIPIAPAQTSLQPHGPARDGREVREKGRARKAKWAPDSVGWDFQSDSSPLASLWGALLAQDHLVGIQGGKWFEADILQLVWGQPLFCFWMLK